MKLLRRLVPLFLCLLLTIAAPAEESHPVRPAEVVKWRVSADGKTRAKTVQLDENASMGLLRFEQGASVPPHRHRESTEMLYILSGGGRMIVAGQEFEVKAGDVVSIPPATEHSFTATWKGEAVQVYSPPGPEQRFLKWDEE